MPGLLQDLAESRPDRECLTSTAHRRKLLYRGKGVFLQTRGPSISGLSCRKRASAPCHVASSFSANARHGGRGLPRP
jgi:hypothetical protein